MNLRTLLLYFLLSAYSISQSKKYYTIYEILGFNSKMKHKYYCKLKLNNIGVLNLSELSKKKVFVFILKNLFINICS